MMTIHYKEAMALLESGEPVDLKLWKLTTGEILHYKQVRFISAYRRGGTHRVKFPNGEIRGVRDITVFEINGKTIYR